VEQGWGGVTISPINLTFASIQVSPPFSGPEMRNISHFFWVKFTYLFLAQPLPYWHSFRTLGWETLLTLKAGKYGKKFFSILWQISKAMYVCGLKETTEYERAYYSKFTA
jgi:hypothetical protein